jgi:hypothetical protein
MTSPAEPPPGVGNLEAVRTGIEQLGADLHQVPVSERLAALAALATAFDQAHSRARLEAITAARSQGWGLRRIAAAAGCSHEQIRTLLATPPELLA